MGNWTPEMVTALGSVLIGVLAFIFGKGKQKAVDEAKPTTHQEVIRPETAAEAKSADALERIAAGVEKIERNVDLFLDRNRNS